MATPRCKSLRFFEWLMRSSDGLDYKEGPEIVGDLVVDPSQPLRLIVIADLEGESDDLEAFFLLESPSKQFPARKSGRLSFKKRKKVRLRIVLPLIRLRESGEYRFHIYCASGKITDGSLNVRVKP